MSDIVETVVLKQQNARLVVELEKLRADRDRVFAVLQRELVASRVGAKATYDVMLAWQALPWWRRVWRALRGRL